MLCTSAHRHPPQLIGWVLMWVLGLMHTALGYLRGGVGLQKEAMHHNVAVPSFIPGDTGLPSPIPALQKEMFETVCAEKGVHKKMPSKPLFSGSSVGRYLQ